TGTGAGCGRIARADPAGWGTPRAGRQSPACALKAPATPELSANSYETVQFRRVTSRRAFANILICQCLAGESGGPVSMQIGIH
ncbi:MAG: hypothetical protein WB421_17940, partial [Terriglobales bacterium]